MIYFLINNNYHIDLDLFLAKQLNQYKLGLIQIPFSLDVLHKNDLFEKIVCFENNDFGSYRKAIFQYRKTRKFKKKIDSTLDIASTDILLVHTEIIPLNQYIIQLFYNANAKVFLLEDGVGTMVDNNLEVKKSRLQDKIRTLFYKKILGLKYSSILNFGYQILPRMPDYIFKGVIVNYGEKLNRKIPLYKLRQNQENLQIEYKESCIFFSQSLYLWFLSEEEYLNFIESFLTECSQKFQPFYFKFHPSEKETVKNQLTRILGEKFPNVKIITGQIIAEKLIYTYPVQYAISINSTATLNLISKNITPIFMIDIFNKLYPTKDGAVFSDFLKSIKCNTPKFMSEVSPNFISVSQIYNDNKTFNITEIINLSNDND